MNRFAPLAGLLVVLAAPPAPAQDARRLLADAGVSGGLVVHLGCGDGTLTAALRLDDGFAVHGLDADPANVAKARAHIRSKGLYGPVAADVFDGTRLPYIDHLVNLVVAGAPGGVPEAEILRVLAPGGVAVIGGRKTVKPRPEAIDAWTHYLHGPDNNAVADDTVVGPPRRLQWQAGPKWTRHHDRMSSLSALVTDGGRLYCILDEGSTTSILLPARWALIARDAFNGKALWERPIGEWLTTARGLKDGPADAPRRLVAGGGRVYATLGLRAPVSCLDAATGKTVRDYPQTKDAEELLLADGVLFVLAGPGSIGDGGRPVRPAEKRTLLALRAENGETLWRAEDVVAALTPAVDAMRLYYFNFDAKTVKALDRATGKPLWSSAPLPAPERQMSYFGCKLVVADGVVLLASGEVSGMIKSTGGATKDDTLTALDAATGKTLWTAPHPPSGYSSPENVFVIGGVVWCDTSSNGSLDGTVVGYDLKTGAVRQRFPADETRYWFHHRCYAGRATSRYLLTSRTGVEFIDLEKKHWDLNHWVRGACLYGVMPANGLLYAPPSPCICYAETYLHSFNALAPAASGGPVPPDPSPRLEKGPAFGSTGGGKAPAGDWPTYRGDAARSGAAKAAGPASPAPAWTADVGGRLSAVTVAGGRLFVAAVDRHEVHALDAGTGKPAWTFTAGGRVDSPPTVHEGLVLFGSADGCVYALRAEDGALAWRFRAAPADRRTLVYEQIESLWPVHGSVLVRDGVVHAVAGRSLFVDGGMRLVRVDAKTGALVTETLLDDRNPETGKNVQDTVKWLNMAVGRPDILSCDGKRIYMRSQSFDLEGKRLALGPELDGPREGTRQGGEGTHLFCPTGFLDDTGFHRTYWLYGKTWGSGWNGYYIGGQHAPGGKIMAVGDDRVYAFDRQKQYYRWTVPMEFRLYAARKEWAAAPAGEPGIPEKPAGKGKAKAGAKAPKDGGGAAPVSNPRNYAWTTDVPILVRAMALAGDTLFVAGPRDVFDEAAAVKQGPGGPAAEKQEAALAGTSGGVLWAVSAADGAKRAELALDSPPVWDGLAVADGRIYFSTLDGKVVCLK